MKRTSQVEPSGVLLLVLVVGTFGVVAVCN